MSSFLGWRPYHRNNNDMNYLNHPRYINASNPSQSHAIRRKYYYDPKHTSSRTRSNLTTTGLQQMYHKLELSFDTFTCLLHNRCFFFIWSSNTIPSKKRKTGVDDIFPPYVLWLSESWLDGGAHGYVTNLKTRSGLSKQNNATAVASHLALEQGTLARRC